MKSYCVVLLSIGLLNSASLRLISIPTTPRVAESVQKNLPEAGEIITAKEQLRGYVLDVKEKFKPSDKEYKEARKLFRDATSEYMGWIGELKLAIISGTSKDLRKDELYQLKSQRAGKAGKAFVDYAQDVTAQSKSIIPFLSAMADMGIRIWNAKKDRESKERKAYAEAFAETVKWERWEEIAPTPQKPEKTNR